jgi:phosphatidylglycerol:prolipoprotein diacylglycerol transferase
MLQVLFRIPTESRAFPYIVAVLAAAGGILVWTMFTQRKALMPVFMALTGFLGFRLADYIAGRAPDGIPIYGYGLMLFLAFVACTSLASRLARREGIAPEHVQDLAIYLFVGGVVGSRLVFMIQYHLPWSHFLYIWEGGLVFYGGMLGGAVAYVVAYYTVIRKNGLSTLKLADIIAPCAALGLCLGRVGCLLNGCCYGEVACPDCLALRFPLSGMPRDQLVKGGYQTAAGFTSGAAALRGPAVGAVEPGSAADRAGLMPGDVIAQLDGHDIRDDEDLRTALEEGWPRGKNDLTLEVERGADQQELTLTFAPKTLGLHPTQAYESISMALLLFLLLAYFPYRRHDGELFALFLILYPLHRFLNEMLRGDNEKVGFGLTLSQNGSVLVLLMGVAFFLWLRRLPAQYKPGAKPLPA